MVMFLALFPLLEINAVPVKMQKYIQYVHGTLLLFGNIGRLWNPHWTKGFRDDESIWRHSSQLSTQLHYETGFSVNLRQTRPMAPEQSLPPLLATATTVLPMTVGA